MKRFQAFTLAVLALCALSACNFIFNKNENGQAQGITGASSSGQGVTSPTDPACSVKVVDLGTEGDRDKLFPGGDAVKVSVTLVGQQDLELLDQCRASKAPTFSIESVPTPDQCALEGGGFDTKVRARLAAVVGTTCILKARAGGVESNEFRFTVVAAS